MMAVGFYITPALVGGPREQMVSTWIASSINDDLNWGMAAALAVELLGMTVAVIALARLLLPHPAIPGRVKP
jgi:putative spermidine/putrescine transport system permease protein